MWTEFVKWFVVMVAMLLISLGVSLAFGLLCKRLYKPDG